MGIARKLQARLPTRGFGYTVIDCVAYEDVPTTTLASMIGRPNGFQGWQLLTKHVNDTAGQTSDNPHWVSSCTTPHLHRHHSFEAVGSNQCETRFAHCFRLSHASHDKASSRSV